ncbi:flagellar biosynthetic protein FliO [Paenibacillus sp. ACRSA]|uniref:flagellar biosynthetic protein FliO n=1 Tax=Paenibacillus sp. ACRSA TaxID=2918211 RepID=UPI001EF5032B|nr:flagellar biosynthetic protein FliO [Paenibacillus sp. ACRSA]MCG7376919.1 flagellar biosynthetic protein FliO [Paenibacillus sp. ACRSA]
MMAQDGNPMAGTNYYLQLVWVIVVLAVILALIVYLIRFLNKRNQQWFRNGTVRILGGVGLGPNKSLQIIEIGGNVYLLGVGDDIQLVDKISDLDEAQRIIDSFEREASSPNGSLSPLINKLTARFRKEEPPREIELEDTTSFHELFESKLRQMPNRKEKMEKLLKEEDNTTDRSRDS